MVRSLAGRIFYGLRLFGAGILLFFNLLYWLGVLLYLFIKAAMCLMTGLFLILLLVGLVALCVIFITSIGQLNPVMGVVTAVVFIAGAAGAIFKASLE